MRLAIKKLLLLTTVLVLCAGYAPAQQKPAGKSVKHHRHGKRRGAWKKKGQQTIKSDRATEIQQALIREHYLTGEPSGVWDTRTQAALVKYQADNGWQTKVVPDSRALIKLGLGPNYSSQMLNPPASSTPAAATSAASRSLNDGADKR